MNVLSELEARLQQTLGNTVIGMHELVRRIRKFIVSLGHFRMRLGPAVFKNMGEHEKKQGKPEIADDRHQRMPFRRV